MFGPASLARLVAVRTEARTVDQALFDAIANADTPNLDIILVRLSRAADFSRLWLGTALGIAAVGGAQARRGAGVGVCAIGLASAVTNIAVKPAFGRRRPLPSTSPVPDSRRVRRPVSTSFPSGHTASAFAFASAVGEEVPGSWGPLHAAAVLVGYSRVHTGAHYPSDVVAGAMIGAMCGWATRSLAQGRAGLIVSGRTRKTFPVVAG